MCIETDVHLTILYIYTCKGISMPLHTSLAPKAATNVPFSLPNANIWTSQNDCGNYSAWSRKLNSTHGPSHDVFPLLRHPQHLSNTANNLNHEASHCQSPDGATVYRLRLDTAKWSTPSFKFDFWRRSVAKVSCFVFEIVKVDFTKR